MKCILTSQFEFITTVQPTIPLVLIYDQRANAMVKKSCPGTRNFHQLRDDPDTIDIHKSVRTF